MEKISVDLWFDTNAQEAVDFYMSIFPDSRINATATYGPDMPGPEGEIMYIDFQLNGQRFGAVNGGPMFKFSPAVSLVIGVKDQDELDRYWNALSAVPEAEQCGWLQDKFGLSWQVVPEKFAQMMKDPDKDKVNRVMQAMMPMKKIDIEALEKAAAG